MSRVWPDVTVEEGSLRFHMASLRKRLGDGRDGARYITTLAGRGYCFVAPVSGTNGSHHDAPAAAIVLDHPNLPHRLDRMVGRDNDVLELSAQLTASRVVTIVGAGGVGKTTVAVAVAHHLVAAFAGSVLFVDLGMLSDGKLAATTVASMLGLSVQSDDATPSLISFLKSRRILLILDTCEHLVEAVATLAASLTENAPQVRILATSREALRIEGEHVYRLAALGCPPDAHGLTAADVQQFPAVQLFVECARASGAHLNVSDAEAPIVAEICRKLDGVALAIELVARHIDSYGLQETAALLDQRLTLLWLGSRTAPPRQKTLQATLDWSYGLLSEVERVVLRRLAVFIGHFTLDAALEVATVGTVDRSTVFGAIDNLVAKSMVAIDPIGAMMRYRLLDTTRAYALEISLDGAEFANLATRHAAYYRRWLQQAEAEWLTLPTGTGRASYFAALNNVRAALEWCFGVNGNAGIGVGLAAAAATVFLVMGLLTECRRWSERAILALDDAIRGRDEEMRLQAALGLSSMFGRGGSDNVRVAFNRSLVIAEEHGNVDKQVQALSMLCMLYGTRFGDFKTALQHAKNCSAVSKVTTDPATLALGHSMLGMSLQFRGDLSGARVELELARQHGSAAWRTSAAYLGFNGYVLVGAYLARTLWLQGHPAQAVECARQTVEDATPTDHPVTQCIALVWAILVFLGTGDLESAEEYLDRLISIAKSHSFQPYLALGRGFRGQLDIRNGNTQAGIEKLKSCLEEVHAARYEILSTAFEISLIQGLLAIDRFDDCDSLIDDTIRRVETNGDIIYMPELLRVKGSLFLSMPQLPHEEAEKCFTQSLELSRRLDARAWELRSATDMAALLAGRGQPEVARGLLRPLFEQFTEGSNTADIKAAERLLTTLN
jgi:predicted ATPase